MLFWITLIWASQITPIWNDWMNSFLKRLLTMCYHFGFDQLKEPTNISFHWPLVTSTHTTSYLNVFMRYCILKYSILIGPEVFGSTIPEIRLLKNVFHEEKNTCFNAHFQHSQSKIMGLKSYVLLILSVNMKKYFSQNFLKFLNSYTLFENHMVKSLAMLKCESRTSLHAVQYMWQQGSALMFCSTFKNG